MKKKSLTLPNKLRQGVTRGKRGYWSRLHRDQYHAKHFSDVKYGGQEQAYLAACHYQDKLEQNHPRKRFHARPHRSKKDNLPVGVYHSHTITKKGEIIPKFAASWTDPKTHKRHAPTFYYDPTDPTDRNKQRRAAIQLRKSKEKEIKQWHG